MSQKKRIVIWCGNAPNHRALSHKIGEQFEISGIVIDMKRQNKKSRSLKRVLTAIADRVFFRSIHSAWGRLQQKYSEQYPQWPTVSLARVDSINSNEAFEFTRNLSPDLIVVSGTALVKSKMLSLQPRIGIINLHTGLSPYIKGGPNCTNWCIATKQYEKIGNTIMWINEGIDAGNIITSERTTLSGGQDLYDLQWQVMQHAHALYLRAIQYLFNTQPPYQSVPQQQIGKGTLYLTKMWDFNAKRKLSRHLPDFLNNRGVANDNSLITVPLGNNNEL